MLLAFNEIMNQKIKFGLIGLSVALVVFMMTMLSGLGNGLYVGMVGAINGFDADFLVLQKDVSLSIPRSELSSDIKKSLSSVKGLKSIANIGFLGVNVKKGGKSFDAGLFGYEPGSLGDPGPLVKGRSLRKTDENAVIIDISAEKKYKLAVGDVISLSTGRHKLKIVGMISDRQYSLTPTLYSTLKTWNKIKISRALAMAGLYSNRNHSTNALAKPPTSFLLAKVYPNVDLSRLKSRLQKVAGGIDVATKQETILKMKGVGPQDGAIKGIQFIAFLVGLVLIGFFFYILVLQKIEQIGMFKALGASSSYVFQSLFIQSLFLGTLGISAGATASFLAANALPASMPFALSFSGVLISIIGTFFMTIGGVFLSLRRIVKIEPMIAMRKG